MRWILRMLIVAGLFVGMGCSNKKSSNPGDPPIPSYPPGKGANGGKTGLALPPK